MEATINHSNIEVIRVRYYSSKKQSGLHRANIVVPANSLKEAKMIATSQMNALWQMENGILEPCHHRMKENGKMMFCFMVS